MHLLFGSQYRLVVKEVPETLLHSTQGFGVFPSGVVLRPVQGDIVLSVNGVPLADADPDYMVMQLATLSYPRVFLVARSEERSAHNMDTPAASSVAAGSRLAPAHETARQPLSSRRAARRSKRVLPDETDGGTQDSVPAERQGDLDEVVLVPGNTRFSARKRTIITRVLEAIESQEYAMSDLDDDAL